MNGLKRNNMMRAYTGFRGTQTVGAIQDQIPEELLKSLTGKQLGILMNVIDSAYKKGKAAAGAEIVDLSREDGAVYINGLGMIEWKEVDAKYEKVEEPYITSGGTNLGVMISHKKIENGRIEAIAKFD